MSHPPLLSVRDLSVVFDSRRGALTALDHVSLDIAAGEVLGVVGKSGAGKSLTGTAIIGLLDPPGRIAGGSITFDGRRIDTLPPAEMRALRGRHIAAIFQDPLTSLHPLLTVGDQLIETIVTHLPMSRTEARSRALGLLADVGIPAPELRIDQYPHQFSGGMRQRVVIALALSAEPRLIVADEPTTALVVERHLGARTEGQLRLVFEHDLGETLIADGNDLVLDNAVFFRERARFLVNFGRHLIDDLRRKSDRRAVFGKS